MKKKEWKRYLAVGLVLILVLTMTSCGRSFGDSEGATDFEREEESTETGLPPAVAAEVALPKEAQTMAYPIWALLVSAAIDRLPYYGYPGNATDENAEAFYAPMSVLTTLMEEKTDKGEGQKTKDDYYKLSEERFSSYANALFDSYGMQAIEAPELPDDSFYARETEDDAYPYAFDRADLSDYHSVITGCTVDQENYGYEVVAELRDIKQKTVLYEATFTLIPTSFEGEEKEDLFSYSISKITDEMDYVLEMGEEAEDPASVKEKTEETPEGPEATTIMEETDSSSSSTEKKAVEEPEPNPDEIPADPSGKIDQDQAGEVAKNYCGDGEVTYEGKESLEGQDYYNYSYQDEDGREKNILIPSDGTEPVSGTKNDDGTWTFDQ